MTKRSEPQGSEHPDLPPPGPVYIISDTGFGPIGRYDEEPKDEPGWLLAKIRTLFPLGWIDSGKNKREHS